MAIRKLWFAAGLVLSATLIEAQETRRPPAPSLPIEESAPSIIEASDEELAKWIEELAAGDFHARERARTRLRLAGKSTIAVLASRLAQADELETIVRGTSLLGEFARSRDRITRATARQALLELSKNGNGSVAQRAQAILNPVDVSNIEFRGGRLRVNAVRVVNRNAPVMFANPPAPAPQVPPKKPSAELERLQRAYDDARRLASQEIVPSAEMTQVLRHLERELVRQLERDLKGQKPK